MTEPLLTFSDAACAHIKKMLAKKKDGMGFRITIKKTGCSGYTYVPAIAETINPADSVFMIADDLPVYVDVTWLHLLKGVHVDFVEDNRMGLKQKRLIFVNPNESSRCGCGESFHVGDQHVS